MADLPPLTSLSSSAESSRPSSFACVWGGGGTHLARCGNLIHVSHLSGGQWHTWSSIQRCGRRARPSLLGLERLRGPTCCTTFCAQSTNDRRRWHRARQICSKFGEDADRAAGVGRAGSCLGRLDVETVSADACSLFHNYRPTSGANLCHIWQRCVPRPVQWQSRFLRCRIFATEST